jgi:2,4-dienoyl-CoA reductase (NADPH2)
MSWSTGVQPVSASALSQAELPGFEAPRELSVAEIEEIVLKVVNAAERAQKAGFDGVEINAAASHLFATFLSRLWNRRQDAYGCGSLVSRAKIMVDMIGGIKERLGRDYPVSVIMNALEFGGQGAITIEESQGIARILETAGADAIQLRCHRVGSVVSLWPEHLFYPEEARPLPEEADWSRKGAGAYVPLAAAIKKVVSIPVAAVGRLDPELGENALREGKVDFIAMTRRLFADPELPNKIASGRLEDIAPCTACLCCLDRIMDCKPLRCRINASLGREKEYELKPAEKRKKVLVIGGGPAGMEAARVTALRGHEVMLHAREPNLGGLMPVAALVKGLEIEDLRTMIDYFKTQLSKLDVSLSLGKETTLPAIEEIRPDVVIVAAGGLPALPDIPGIDGPNVIGASDLYARLRFYLRIFGPKTLRRLTKLWMPLGKRVVVIGGAIQGCELAEFLVKRGRKVTIVDMAEELGEAMGAVNKLCLFAWLSERGVTMMPGVKYQKITDKGLNITDRDGRAQTIVADTIVTATPLKPNPGLLKTLEGVVPEIHSIGDCVEPRLIIDAVAGGFRIACAV